MKIAFFDSMDIDYDASTPLSRPLGGTQSAVCYLAAALAQAGHHVSLINRTALPGLHNGVQSYGMTKEGFLASDGVECIRSSEALIVINAPAGRWLRRHYPVKGPMVLWAHNTTDIPYLQDLQDPQERGAWNAFAFTSQWALTQYAEQFGIRPELARVFHNGIAPAFAVQDLKPAWFESGAAPILAYTSPPFRGLDVLLDAFPAIRAAIPEVRLRVYSGMSLYGQSHFDPHYQVLYDRCRDTPGATYVGPIAQDRLASELSDSAALAYPSTYAETFCIAAAEAMSTGALLLTTTLGALPELFGEFALMIESDADQQRLAANYAAHVVAALQSVRRDPGSAAARRADQIDFIRTEYFWPSIALQWGMWLRGLARNR